MKIVLVEDHTMFREALRSKLLSEREFEVVGETGDGLEAIDMVDAAPPDVVVLDLALKGLDGLEVLRRIDNRHPEAAVLVVSMHSNEAYVSEAFRNGAAGFVVKEESIDDFVDAVRSVARGERYLSPSLDQKKVAEYKARAENLISDRYDLLTGREREVLQLIGEGLSGPQIAERLFISPRTVSTHRSNLMAKLDIHNHAELVRYALDRGLISPGSDPSDLPR